MPAGAEAEALGAVFNLVTVVVLALPAGLALLRVFGMYFVDQSISTAEAAVTLLAVVMVVVLTAVAPVIWLRPVPLILGVVGWYLAARAVQRRQQTSHQGHLDSEERKALAMLARDPSATVAYERLHAIRFEQGRLEEAREALLAWQRTDPRSPAAMRLLRRLDAELGLSTPRPAPAVPGPPTPSAPEPPPAPQAVAAPVDLAADLDDFAGTPESAAAPEPEPARPALPTAAERELEAFAPPDETPDDRPVFGPVEEPEQPQTGVLGAVPAGRVDHPLVDEDPLAPAFPEEGEDTGPTFSTDQPDPGLAARPAPDKDGG